MKPDDLTDFFTEAANNERLLLMFWTIAQVRYITFPQLKTVKKPWAQHIATRPKLKQLSEKNYLDTPAPNLYTPTLKTLDYLHNHGYNTAHLQKRWRGEGTGHSLKITDALLPIMDEPHFFTVFYPTFTAPPRYEEKFLEPDACLIYKRDDAFKLVFLEVEEEKGAHEQYLEAKQSRYNQIAADPNTFEKWWRHWADKLRLPVPKQEQFGFSIRVINHGL